MVKFKDAKEVMDKPVNLLVYDYGARSKNGRAFLDVQVDARDKNVKDGANLAPTSNASLHLVEAKSHYKDKNGNVKETYKTQEGYTENQFDKIKNAAGSKVQSIQMENGKTVDIYAIKAQLKISSTSVYDKDMNFQKNGAGIMAINTAKDIKQSDFQIGPKIREGQFDKMMAIKETVKEAFAAQKDAPKAAEKATEVESKPKAKEVDGPDA